MEEMLKPDTNDVNDVQTDTVQENQGNRGKRGVVENAAITSRLWPYIEHGRDYKFKMSRRKKLVYRFYNGSSSVSSTFIHLQTLATIPTGFSS